MATDPSATSAAETSASTEAESSKIAEKLSFKSVTLDFEAHTQREGKGFIVNRPIGGRAMTDEQSDPFLMLDELGPKEYEKGEFVGTGWHPHRGFDTVMYLKEGYGRHEDRMGNSGILGPGDCQWMTAGRGIEHREGRDHPGGMLHGFQMWVNLPAKHKMCDPQYQTLTASRLPFVKVADGVRAKVLAGEIRDAAGRVKASSPIKPIQPIEYVDFEFEAGANFTQLINSELETTILYCYKGEGFVRNGGKMSDDSDSAKWTSIKRKRTVLLGKGDSLQVRASKEQDLGFLLLCGKPIREPVARHGPFVMTTDDEIRQAFSDYRMGKFSTYKAKEILDTEGESYDKKPETASSS